MIPRTTPCFSYHQASCSNQVLGRDSGSIHWAYKALHHLVVEKFREHSKRIDPESCNMSWVRHIGMHSSRSTSKANQSCNKCQPPSTEQFPVLLCQADTLLAHSRYSSSSMLNVQWPSSHQLNPSELALGPTCLAGNSDAFQNLNGQNRKIQLDPNCCDQLLRPGLQVCHFKITGSHKTKKRWSLLLNPRTVFLKV